MGTDIRVVNVMLFHRSEHSIQGCRRSFTWRERKQFARSQDVACTIHSHKEASFVLSAWTTRSEVISSEGPQKMSKFRRRRDLVRVGTAKGNKNQRINKVPK